ncbi:STAS domain-containing protein [Luteimonas saliphila]|uniref:STAS domain-containing protein n=1 Tax=Luteimonas saliphila TaxID=2804919 RepID=UPI00192E1388|nr:STAS domain-containing protein [Luteimonas saliphila]
MNHLTLQTDLGIERVAELQAALQPHLEDDAPLQLAGDRVERVHAAGLQLLHAFVRDRAARGQTTTITQASPTLAAAARQLALAVSLGVDGTDPADMQPEHTTLPTAANGATA